MRALFVFLLGGGLLLGPSSSLAGEPLAVAIKPNGPHPRTLEVTEALATLLDENPGYRVVGSAAFRRQMYEAPRRGEGRGGLCQGDPACEKASKAYRDCLKAGTEVCPKTRQKALKKVFAGAISPGANRRASNTVESCQKDPECAQGMIDSARAGHLLTVRVQALGQVVLVSGSLLVLGGETSATARGTIETAEGFEAKQIAGELIEKITR